jgi:hypothetical protein
MPHLRSLSPLVVVVAIAVLGASCDSSSDAPSTSAGAGGTEGTSSTTTTLAPVTSIPAGSVPGTDSPSIPGDVAALMRAQIGTIILDVEESRGLPFLEVPTVTILDSKAFTERVNQQLTTELDGEQVAGQDAMFTLLGMLDPDVDLERLLIDLYTEQVAGFYDPDAKEMVVPVSIDGITPLQEITIAHELVHALTDQHFDFNDEYERRVDEGTGDDAAGMLGLVEGDATYQQFLYLESFDPAKAANAALEALSIDTSVLQGVPSWIQKDLTFPYEQGLVFTGYLVEEGGLEAVDEAYQAPPSSTEQILDPVKYTRNELPEDLAPLTVELDGWDLFDEAAFGEWGVRLLLTDTLPPGELTQVAAGWGNDTYRLFLRGDDTTFVWSYLAETVEDAEELTNALITHLRTKMDVGASQESLGGLEFVGGSTYAFIDRVDDAIFLIASTDAAAGGAARTQLGI